MAILIGHIGQVDSLSTVGAGKNYTGKWLMNQLIDQIILCNYYSPKTINVLVTSTQ